MAKRKQWYMLNLRSGYEGQAAFGLQRRGVDVVVPKISRRGGNPRRWTLQSHVFARFSTQNEIEVLLTPGVVGIAGIPNPIPVPDRHISNLKAAMDIGLSVQIVQKVSKTVRGRVSSGPLSRQEGDFIKRNDVWNLVMTIEAVGWTLVFPLHHSTVTFFPENTRAI